MNQHYQDNIAQRLPTKTLCKPITILLTTIILILLHVILLPFILLRLSLQTILGIVHGESFGGLLSGLDTIFEMNPNKVVVNVINIYSSKDDPTLTIQKLRDVVHKIHNSSFKFSTEIRRIFGYCYYIKDQLNIEDVIHVVRYNRDPYMNREMLFDYLKRYCARLHENQMWKVVIFEQPILWSRTHEDEYKQYAVVWILRHSLGDGPAIITIFQKYAVEDGIQNVDTTNLEKIKRETKDVNLDNVYLRRNPATTELDGEALKIPNNSDWYIASAIESRSKYISKIKKIKDGLNVNFGDVLNAAITASVHDYVKERQVTLNNFTIAKVIRLKLEDLLKLRQGMYKFEQVENNFGFIALQLPRNVENYNMKDLVQYLHDYNESLRYAVDPLVAFVVLRHICHYLPTPLTKISCGTFMEGMTIGVTNLVGFNKSSLCDNKVDDIFFFTSDVLNTVFTFSVFSYDGRFQMILTSREGFVRSQDELQRMLENVFKYIDEIEAQL